MKSTVLVLLLLPLLSTGFPATEQDENEEALMSTLLAEFGDELILEEDESEEVLSTEQNPDLPTEDSSDTLPDHFDYREVGIVSPPLKQHGCPSCTFHAATLVLESRMARVSEHYVRYSIQDFMNCAGKICVGSTAGGNWNFLRSTRYIARYEESKYVQKDCLNLPEGCVCGKDDQQNYPNAFNEQFAFMGPTVKTGKGVEKLERALQGGPVLGIVFGGAHALTVVGYNDSKWILQESGGPEFGKFNDGTRRAAWGSDNDKCIQSHAAYPVVFYDYDRANAYYTKGEGVSEAGLVYVDEKKWGVTDKDTADLGSTKNKCAFLGSACKGVVMIGSQFRLVADFSGAGPGDLVNERKTQMVVYLRHHATGKYITLKKRSSKLLVRTSSDKSNAAPFFSSLGRLVSYDYPDHDLVGKTMKKTSPAASPYSRGPDEIWTMSDCVLHNPTTGMALSRIPVKRWSDTVGGRALNLTDPLQRFTVGLSEEWVLTNKIEGEDDSVLRYDRRNNVLVVRNKGDTRFVMARMRWNGRQIVNPSKGWALNSDFSIPNTMFKFGEKEKEVQPVDCKLNTIYPSNYLDLNAKGGVVTSSDPAGGWTFEYADL